MAVALSPLGSLTSAPLGSAALRTKRALPKDVLLSKAHHLDDDGDDDDAPAASQHSL